MSPGGRRSVARSVSGRYARPAVVGGGFGCEPTPLSRDRWTVAVLLRITERWPHPSYSSTRAFHHSTRRSLITKRF
eukprot:7170458-Prymnesium_polylepis.1